MTTLHLLTQLDNIEHFDADDYESIDESCIHTIKFVSDDDKREMLSILETFVCKDYICLTHSEHKLLTNTKTK